MTKAQITIPLDIPDVRVLQTSLDEHGFDLESTMLRNSPRLSHLPLAVAFHGFSKVA